MNYKNDIKERLIKDAIKDFEIIPQKKEEIKLELMNIISNITTTKEELKIISSETYLEVLGNKELKNEASKGAMVVLILSKHKQHKELTTRLLNYEKDRLSLEAELTRFRAKITLYTIISKLIGED